MEDPHEMAKRVDHFLLKKLSKDYEESDVNAEYQVRNNRLKQSFNGFLGFLNQCVFSQTPQDVSISFPYILILYLELQCPGPWNIEDRNRECLEELNQSFRNRFNVDIVDVLKHEKFACQAIFDTCIKELHKKLTVEDYRKYPTLIAVYGSLVKNAMKYKVIVNPVTVLPIALLLIDDYMTPNKIKGLRSCMSVLLALDPQIFTSSNFYEVVYISLKKNIAEKGKEVTHALCQCLFAYLNAVPSDIKKIKLDDIYANVLDQLHTEPNFYRKADYFYFLNKIIDMHGIHCAKKKIFKDIICANLEECSNEAVSQTLLQPVLECLQTWLKYCWGIWKLSNDHKILAALFKMLYLTKKSSTAVKIQNIILTLTQLCTEDEQTEILEILQETFECPNPEFLSRVETIKKQIVINL